MSFASRTKEAKMDSKFYFVAFILPVFMAVYWPFGMEPVGAELRWIDTKHPTTIITPDGAICDHVEEPGDRFIVKCPSTGHADFDFTINGAPVIMGTAICISPSMELSCVPGKGGRWDIEMLCLAKMQKAMKAMEQYYFIGNDARTNKAKLGEYQGFVSLWNETKKECWNDR